MCDTVTFFDTLEFTILESFDLNFITTPEDCGMCNGEATVIPTGISTPPYVYNWTGLGGANSSSINGLCPGVYTVEVTDSLGCLSIDSVTITSIGGPQFNLTITEESCLGAGDAAIQVIPIIQAGYNYALNNIPQGGDTFLNLQPGSYTVSLIDTVLNCQTDSIVLIQPGQCCLSIYSNVEHPTCSGDCDGSLEVSPNNFFGSVEIILEDLNTNVSFNGSNITNLCEGIYALEVSDSLCTITDTFNLQGTPLPLVQIDDTLICAGVEVQIEALVSNTNGAPVDYNWSTGDIGSMINFTTASDSVISIQVMASGCLSEIDSATISIAEFPTISVISDTNLCRGSSIELSAEMQGGITPYSYEWELVGGQWTANVAEPTISLK